MSFSEIVRRSIELSTALVAQGFARGDRLAFILPNVEQALTLVLACLRNGIGIVPLREPFTAGELTDFPQRVARALATSAANALVVSTKSRALLPAAAPVKRTLTLEALVSEGSLVSEGGGVAPMLAVAPDESAVILISADAGADARAKTLTHADLISTLTDTAAVLSLRKADVFVSWLPPSDEAGLIALLLPLYCERSCGLLSTLQFLKRPASWLETISRTQATISFAPEHGYAFCSKRAEPAQLEHVDLSRWRIAGAAGAAIGAETSAAFTRAFADHGFPASAFADSPVVLPYLTQRPQLALSHGQKALWFLQQLAPDSSTYNVPLCVRISSALDESALRRALAALLTRHDALRSVFPARAGEPYRKLQPGASVTFQRFDVAQLDEAELTRFVLSEVERPFDLEVGPLFVTKLFERGPDDAILLLVVHHINVDGSSLLLLGAELSYLYEAFARGASPPPLPAPEHTYDDFVRWQAERLASSEGARLRRYWAEQLAGAPRAIGLRSDRARPALRSERGASVALRLPDATSAALQELARRHDTTLYTVLLAAFYALLQQESGDEDLLVATPVVGRSGAVFRDVIGYFVNTLPIRARATPRITFDALVSQLRATVLAALDHQDLPYTSILDGARPARDASHLPLCQVMFQLQTFRPEDKIADTVRAYVSGGESEFAGLRARGVELARPVTQFELMLELNAYGDGVSGVLAYSTDLFDAGSAQRLADAFVQLAGALAREPSVAIEASFTTRLPAAAPPLDPTERALLARWNDTAVEYPAGSVPEAIARRAALQPTAIALSFGAESVTYAELDRRADRIASHLRSTGVARDVLVGVMMERSVELPIVLLAVLEAGGAYVPLDPTLPDERLELMLEDSQVEVVIADAASVPRLTALVGGRARILSTTQIRELAGSHSSSDPASRGSVDPEDLAYVIYTSGSTGTPKGVANCHAGLWNRLCWMQERYRLQPGDCVLQKTPYGFDVSVWEFFWPLMAGARLALAQPLGHKDSRYLLEEIERSGVTTLHFVPSMLQAFLDEPELKRPPRLARVICSGEALPYSLMLRFFERLPGVELHNLYGPTEASIDVTAWACEPNYDAQVWIGRPIANTQIHILDEQRQQVPIGTLGELYIGGVGLARGYHRRPELTAERFVDNPVPGSRGARLYRTGDLARWHRSGQLEYVGRNDEQIKLRGVRIELGEIEAVALRQPGIARCVVVAHPLPAGGSQLRALVVLQPGAALDARALEATLRAILPDAMIPSRFQRVAEIPLTHSGKVDRRRCAELVANAEEAESLRAEAEGGAPRTREEQLLVEVWEHVLGRPVSIHDNFFALGGDSIRGLQVRALARARGLELDLQALLVHQTVAELAGATVLGPAPEPELRTGPFELLSPADRARVSPGWEDAFPATQLQLGMLYHSQWSAETWTYHDSMSFELELDRPFQPSLMRAALASTQRRHPALRSAFELGSYSEPLQLVLTEVEPPFMVRDLRDHDPAAARALVSRYVESDRTAHYQLERAPLFRLMAHVLEAKRIRLTFSFHHAILDGWSSASLLRELFTEYLRATGASALPSISPPSHSPCEFVALERAAVASDETRDYWRRTLAGAELARIARWPEAHRSSQPGAARAVFAIEPGLTAHLHATAAQLGLPVKSLLLAAHLRVIAAFSGGTQAITGRVIHGRPELAGAERILGLFLNTLPVRAELAGLSWLELVDRLGQAEREAHPHRRLPLREIQRVTGQPTLFETGFNFVNFHLYDALVADGSLAISDATIHENTGFTLMANFVLSPLVGELSLQLEYATHEIAVEQATQIGRAHLLALRALTDDLHASVLASTVIEAPEAARLARFRSGGPSHDAALVHALFERSARQQPDAAAVELGEETLSYAELDGWANAIARRLLAAGAGPRSVVAVCAEPSLERAACVLGVLKAGSAYLPLDPSYPTERLSAMLEDAGVAFVLATQAHASADFLRNQTPISIGARGERAERPALELTPSDPAYVIYTSGSTGRPKGIVMHHAPLANLVHWQVERSALGVGAATAQWAAISFDVSFQELFSTWASGGTVVMVPERSRLDARALVRLLAARGVVRLFAPVVVLHQLAEVAAELDLELPALREINTAGEQLEITDAVRAFFRRHPRCLLDNQYGPSETHVATAQRLEGPPDAWPLTPPIGRPLPGVTAHVLDGSGKHAPIAVPGELYLSGACVATGYYGRPDATEERFVPDPFSGSGARMYRSGDLARYLPDGTLEFLGRRDGQVKIRGYRVELAEIEAALLRAGEGQVQRAAVVTVPSRSRANRNELAAYVVASASAVLVPDTLRSALARSLPAHMIPSTITVLDALPLTPSRKLDRRALPLPLQVPPTARTHCDPDSALEAELSDLWSELLVTPKLSVTDDFFELGGDSLTAVRLMARVQRRFQIELPISVLLEARTVRGLARAIVASEQGGPTSSLVTLTPMRTHARPPLFCVHPVGSPGTELEFAL